MMPVQRMNGDKRGVRMGTSQWIAFIACLLLFLALRVQWIGHLLSYDEASHLLAFRAFASGGADYYSAWFWQHPPAFSVIMLQLSPLAEGFAERAVTTVIVLNALVFLALFFINSRLLGVTPALWTSFFLAVMPGAIFYDTWIKQESLVNLFGLLSLYLFFRKRIPWSGLMLGLAFLSKSLALFYAAALSVLWLLQGSGKRRARDLVGVAAITVGVSAWWYILFAGASTGAHLKFMAGSEAAGMTAWIRPWHYFFEKLPADLGWGGIVLCLFGVGASIVLFLNLSVSKNGPRPIERLAVLWPLAFLIPTYAVLSVVRGKPPWYTMSVYPAFATLQGLGAWGLLSFLTARLCMDKKDMDGTRRGLRRGIIAAISVLFAGVALQGGADRNYESVMKRQYYGMWWGANVSREVALRMNSLVRDGDRALITPMHYWAGPTTPRPCPILVCYLKPMPVVVRHFDAPLEEIVEAIREYKLDWIMISPRPGVGEQAIIRPIMRRYGLRPMLMRGACIFKTDKVYKAAEADSLSRE